AARLQGQLRLHSRLTGRNGDMDMISFELAITWPERCRSGAVRALLLAAMAGGLAACQHNPQPVSVVDQTPPPTDYRQRHPIAIREGQRTVELFIGRSRGGLSPAQRADVAAFGHDWRREATGGIVIDVPTGTENSHAAHAALEEARSVLTASGVPAPVIATRPYQPVDPRIMANLRINYPKMVASAGPCGVWPDNLRPSYERGYNENQEYWNFGCANQRNLAS